MVILILVRAIDIWSDTAFHRDACFVCFFFGPNLTRFGPFPSQINLFHSVACELIDECIAIAPACFSKFETVTGVGQIFFTKS